MLELQARIFLSDRLFMAWRSGPTHFASSQVRFVNIRKLLCTFAFLEFSPEFIFQNYADSSIMIKWFFYEMLCLGIEFNAFAYISQQTKMFIVSSTDFGKTWEKEYELHTGKDLREPYFLEVSYTSSIS